MHGRSVGNRTDIRIFDTNVEALLHRQIVELIVDVVGVLDVLFEADDGESLKGFRLVDHGVKAVGIIQGPRNWRV